MNLLFGSKRRKLSTFIYLLLMAICFLSYSFLEVRYDQYSVQQSYLRWTGLWNQIVQNPYISAEEIDQIKESSCNIPILNPFEQKMFEFFKPIKLKCSKKKKFYFRSDTNPVSGKPLILMENPVPDHLQCCYERLVFRKKPNYRPVKWKNYFCSFISKEKTTIPPNSQYIIINCWNVTENVAGPRTNLVKFERAKKRKHSNLSYPTVVHNELLFYIPTPENLPKRALKKTKQFISFRKRKKLNVIILGFDKISRLNFIRLMRKTFHYLKHNLGAIDLQGFNKVGDATLNNTLAFMTGYDFGDLKVNPDWWKGKNDESENDTYFDNFPWIWKNFSENGYITSYGDDYESVFDYRFLGFKKQPTDYYLHPFTKWFLNETRWKKFGTLSKCIGNQLVLNLLLSLSRNLSRSLRHHPYFSFMWNSRIHETQGYPSLVDDYALKTLKEMESSGELNKSLVILLSDHGWRTGELIEKSSQARVENRMPFAFLLLPKWFRQEYSQAYGNLKENQYRLTSPYDIHATMLDILNYQDKLNDEVIKKRTTDEEQLKKSKGISLFLPVSKKRTCEKAKIDELWCICSLYKYFSNSSTEAGVLAGFAVDTLNSWLKPFPLCAQYKLDEVLNAEAKIEKNASKDATEMGIGNQTFRVSFSVEMTGKFHMAPRFEVILFTEEGFWKYQDFSKIRMSNEVFRLSGYGISADCMKIYALKKICTC